MKEPNEKWIATGFVMALVLLGSAASMLWRSVQDQQNSILRVRHTYEVIEAIRTLVERLSDSENARRGFVLSGDDRYLNHFMTATGRVGKALSSIESLTQDNPRQNLVIRDLLKRVPQRQEIHIRSIKHRKSNGLDLSHQLLLTEEGQETMEPIRFLVNTMTEEENRLLEARQATLNQRVRQTLIFAVTGSTISLITIVTTFILFASANRKRHAAESRLRKTNETLEQRVLNRTAELNESESRLRLTIEGALDAIISTDDTGRITQWNKQATAMLGHLPNEAIAQNVQTLLFRQSTPHPTHPILPDSGSETSRRIETHLFHRDGHKVPVELSIIAVQHDERTIYTFFARDITDRLAAEKASREMNTLLEERVRDRTSQLEAANHELEAFSYSVSHDLRAPLRHIDGFVQMLNEDRDSQLSSSGKRWLAVISDAARQMGQLIDNLLEFSRMGRSQMRQESFPMDDLVHEVLTGIEPEIRGRNIEWRISPLPTVHADRALLRQVWVNLISNAVKYTRHCNPAVIHIEYSAQDTTMDQFTVRDNGAGFDMKYASKLFAVFQRLHHAEEFEGTGIGLAHVRRIVSRHGGRTWAEGALNHGASFHFTLPKTASTALSA